MNQIGTRLSENPRFVVLYVSGPLFRLVSVHVLAAGHRVVVGGAELGGTRCYWLICLSPSQKKSGQVIVWSGSSTHLYLRRSQMELGP